MENDFDVQIEKEGRSTYLSVTHNGTTWTSLRMLNPKSEIPKIINVLERYLTSFKD